MSIYQGQTLIAGGSNTFPLLSFHLTDHILNDISWLRSDTFSWQSGDVYTAAYNHLYNDLQEATLVNGDYKNSNIKNVGLIDNKGVLTGFNTTYKYANFKVKTPTRNLELVIDFITPTTYANASSFLEASIEFKGIICRFTTAGVLAMWMSSNGTSWNVMNNWATGITIPANTKAKFKLTWDGSVYAVFYSLDGGNSWIAGNTLSSTLPIFWNTGEQGIGGCTWESYAFTNGTINLPGCYAIIDDETYWQGVSYNLDYYLAKDNHKIVLAEKENEVIEEYKIKGVAWYFILDVDNNRFKLPIAISKSFRKDVNDSMPDYSRSVVVNKDIVFTAPTNGWISYSPDTNTWVGTSINRGVSGYIAIDGKTVLISSYVYNSDSSHPDTGFFPISAGKTVIHNMSAGTVYFYPCFENGDKSKYLYFYMGNYMQTAIQQTAGLNAELFNGKLDIDSPIAQAPYITEQYDDGQGNGYRVWSNKFCEQWGYATSGWQVTYPKEYANNNYSLVVSTQISASDSTSNRHSCFRDRTTTGFSFLNSSFGITSYVLSFSWEAKGYIL